MKRKCRQDKIFIVCDVILMIGLSAICLYPLYFILIASFSGAGYVTTGKVVLFPRGITLEGYKMMFTKEEIWTGYLNTIFYTVAGTCVNLFLNIPAAYVLSRRTLPFRRGLNVFFLIPMFISGGLVPTYLLVNSLNLVNTVVIMILMGGVNVWNLIICRSFFENNIPSEIFDAAKIDGSSEFGFFVKIALPISKAIIAVMVLFFAVGHWNGYYNALIYLRDTSKYPLQMVLRNLLLTTQLNTEASDSGMEALLNLQSMKYGVIVIASAPVLILYPFIQKYFVKGVMVGAIKG